MRYAFLAGSLVLLLGLRTGLAEEVVRALPARDIAAACLDDQSEVSTEICYAFLLGVVQTSTRLAQSADSHAVPFCLPAKLTRSEALVALRRHFRRHIAAVDQPADRFIIDALADRYPCGR